MKYYNSLLTEYKKLIVIHPEIKLLKISKIIEDLCFCDKINTKLHLKKITFKDYGIQTYDGIYYRRISCKELFQFMDEIPILEDVLPFVHEFAYFCFGRKRFVKEKIMTYYVYKEKLIRRKSFHILIIGEHM